ncbi:hypothetical protein K9N68_00860 [Kovacikia minuta CCNUW1]|uniref:hypothetical protein n=1 Tax=Kovacikia minuta TaxID=2931930 RepID=UPI001CCAE337|nr:hypothetical protein [Kovacikia minuta]UBF26596.1 hypothetical protein K9N68_00860 [Kovacikia minuta CCNUW1]
MKIAIISQPTDGIYPTARGSIGIWTREISTRIGESQDVVVFSKKQSVKDRNVQVGRIEYVKQWVHFDLFITRILGLVRRILRVLLRQDINLFYRYYYYEWYYYLFYITLSALGIRQRKPEWVVIHNFSQFVPIVKFFNPGIKIAIVMHCDWLIELNESVVSKRLQDIDIIFGVSNYITQGVKDKLPQFKSRCHTLLNGCNSNAFKPVGNIE